MESMYPARPRAHASPRNCVTSYFASSHDTKAPTEQVEALAPVVMQSAQKNTTNRRQWPPYPATSPFSLTAVLLGRALISLREILRAPIRFGFLPFAAPPDALLDQMALPVLVGGIDVLGPLARRDDTLLIMDFYRQR